MFRTLFFMLLTSCFLLLFINSCSNPFIETNAQKEERQKTVNQALNSKLIILDVYHNNCESCKHIEPIIEKLKSDYSQNANVSFLKFDISNPFTVYNSFLIARQLGLQDIYKAQRYSGVVLFIDTKNKKVIETLVAEYNVEKYEGEIEKILHAT